MTTHQLLFDSTVKRALSNRKVKVHVVNNIEQSLHSIGCSKSLRKDLVCALETNTIAIFRAKHCRELKEKYAIAFRHRTAPDFLEKEMVAHIPAAKAVVDLGCGNGILVHRLSKYRKFGQIIGADITAYPEWKKFKNKKMKFVKISSSNMEKVLDRYRPHVITITWSLHHIAKKLQLEYLESIYKILPQNGCVIMVEDSYSEKKPPLTGRKRWKAFMKLTKKGRQQFMAVNDWIANKALAGREKVPMPYSYRTVEEWTKLCGGIGFSVKSRFIGFPDKRDINVPQALLVLKK